MARRPSSSSSRSSNDGDWKPSSRPSEVEMLTEKGLARKERRKAVNRASEYRFLALSKSRRVRGLSRFDARLTFIFLNRSGAAAFRLRKKLLLEKQKAVLEEKGGFRLGTTRRLA